MLSYFLADDTLSIFEPPQRNTGITGGKYLERSKVLHALNIVVHCTVRFTEYTLRTRQACARLHNGHHPLVLCMYERL